MTFTFDDILTATTGGATVISENHDIGNHAVGSARFDSAEYAPTQAEGIKRSNLDYSTGRAAVMSVGEVPWHNMGTVISQAATAEEALQFAALAGWNLTKIRQFVEFDGRRIETDSYAIIRQDTGDVLGTVGSRYRIFSNEESFDFMDDVIGGAGARYETAGALAGGRQVWMLAKMPESATVAEGDELQQYVMFGNSHDGSSAIWVYPTSVRTVCQNTYRLSFADRRRGISIRHTKSVRANVAAAKRALGLANDQLREFADTAAELASQPLSKPVEYFNACLDDILDVTVAGTKLTAETIDNKAALDSILTIQDADERIKTERSYNRAVKRRQNILDDILERYESDRCNGNPAISGSAWSAINAVTENSNHSDQWHYKGSSRERAEGRFNSIMNGRALDIQEIAINTAAAMVG